MSIRKLILEIRKGHHWIEEWLDEKDHDYAVENIETGAGSIATVYKIKNEDKVIRIEPDGLTSQKELWSKLVGKNLDHVVEVFLVKILSNGVMIVVMEYLEPLDLQFDYTEVDILHAIGEVITNTGVKDLYEVLEDLVYNIENYSGWFESDMMKNPEQIFDIVDENPKFHRVLEESLKGARELEKIGVKFFDLHPENIMEDPKTGNYKLIDIA